MAVSGAMNACDVDGLLRDIWYFALPSTAVVAGKLVARTLLGEPVVFGRTSEGVPFALRDICPHRGIPLSDGAMVGDEVECCYHGWRFGVDGICTCIPSLVRGQKLELDRIRVRAYQLNEASGVIWIYMASETDVVRPPEAPALPKVAGMPRIVEAMGFPCHIDHAVVGLMDPAHGPFVHQSWWWRSHRSIYEKTKNFAPSELGFTMLRHMPSANSAAYKILGGEVTTEIAFRLPGIRVEHIQVGRHALVGLTAVTPVTTKLTIVYHLIYWSLPWLSVLKPVLRPFARKFLAQDREIVVKQQRGLAHKPTLMLINDADVQAKWYYRLKKAYTAAKNQDTPFENPVRETTLRWRS